MKTFVIEEKFVGYADITIEAETEEEAIALYNRGHYPDSQYDNYNLCKVLYYIRQSPHLQFRQLSVHQRNRQTFLE